MECIFVTQKDFRENGSLTQLAALSYLLHLEKLYVSFVPESKVILDHFFYIYEFGVLPDWWINVPQVQNSPHVGSAWKCHQCC